MKDVAVACTGLLAITALITPQSDRFKDRYISQVAPLAQRMSRSYNAVPASVAIAQSILESNWGRSRSATLDHNYFGIKCTFGRPGPIAISCHGYPTREKQPAVVARAKFRVYASRLDSFRDYGRLMNTPGYRAALRYRNDPDQYIRHVAPRYCTDPQYADHVINTIKAHNLGRFDHVR